MACVHNVVLRGLNAIYLQAPHVQPTDEKSFCAFIGHWHAIISLHHAAEEEDGFPMIEKMAGEEGLIDANVEQLHAFLPGLDALGEYAADCAAGKERYDGRRIVEVIDGFGAVLAAHLADEIPTIEGLRKYGEKKMAGLKGVLEAEAERNKVSVLIKGVSTPVDLGGRYIDVLEPRPNPAWLVYASSLCRTTQTTRTGSGPTGRRCPGPPNSCAGTCLSRGMPKW